MARTYPASVPAQYVADKRAATRARVAGAVGGMLRAWWPSLFPGVPYTAALGFASNGGETEDTANSSAPAAFHELGMFGITGGPNALPAPNTSTAASNDWLRLHADARVRGMLGRDACMTPGCWTSLADQTAVGIASLRDHADAAKRSLGVLAPSEGTAWLPAMAFWSWSAGTSRLARLLRPFADILASVPEQERMNVFGRVLARLYREGTLDLRHGAGGYDSIAHGWTRTRQKLAVAEDLGPTAWFASGAGDDRAWVEDVLAAVASGRDLRAFPEAPSLGGGWGTPLAVAGALGAGALGWTWARG